MAAVLLALPLRAEEDPAQVRALLEEALRMYSEQQYVRALDLFRQVQQVDPENATAAEYIETTQGRLREWERDQKVDISDPAELETRSPRAKSIQNASDIIAARRGLVERMRNRSSNIDNIVKIEDKRNKLTVTLFHDQLFLPGLITLRDEALSILQSVADAIRQKGDRDITLQSMAHANSNDTYLFYPDAPVDQGDPSLPQMKASAGFSMQELETTRSYILFTHLAQRCLRSTSEER